VRPLEVSYPVTTELGVVVHAVQPAELSRRGVHEGGDLVLDRHVAVAEDRRLAQLVGWVHDPRVLTN
jgi:hypothetical protein